MKKLIFCLFISAYSLMFAQEYQMTGTINGREATLLLHFVTSSVNPDEVWSHGSFYFNDDEEVNVIFQYKPIQPEAGLLTFNLIPNSVGKLDYIKGHLTKQDFKGVYSENGKETPFHFTTKKYNDFIIYNYYKNRTRKGKEQKYFGKFISLNNKEASYKLVSFLSNKNSKRMPRTYLKDVYDNIVNVEMEKDPSASYKVNYAIFPIISTPEKVVFQEVKNAHKNGETKINSMDRITYYVKTGEITR